MLDLNTVLFYKTKFNIELINQSNDLLWEFVRLIRKWLYSKFSPDILPRDNSLWSDFKIGKVRAYSNDERILFAESLYFAPDEFQTYWACKIIESPNGQAGFAPRKWITELGFSKVTSTSAEISCVISYLDTPGFIGPCEQLPDISVPRLMRYLAKSEQIKCFVGEDELSIEPTLLQAGDYKSFFEDRLWSTSRKLPYILLCPTANETSSTVLPVDPTRLGISVAMNALVFYAVDLAFQQEMKYYSSPDYLCYPGSVRLYLPNMNKENPSDPIRHRFLAARSITEYGADVVIRIFRRVLAQDIHYNETLFRLSDCIEKKNEHHYQQKLLDIKRVAEVEKKQEVQAAKAAASDEVLEQWMELELQKETAEHDSRILKIDIQELKNENFKLHSQLDSMQVIVQKCDIIQSIYDIQRRLEHLPNNAQEVCQYFETVFSDRIAFTESGKKSIRDCSTQINILWEALYSMCTTLYDLFVIENDPLYNKTFQSKTGWECSRGEGSNTHKDSSLMRQYIDTYNNREVSIESHIKNGNNESDPKFIRIYFGFDKYSQKLIIGSCGKHKENATSRKVK